MTDLKTLRPYFDRLAEDALVGAQGRTRTPAPLLLASKDESADAIVADIPRTPHGRTGRWRLAVAAAVAAALIVATIVLVRTASDDGGTVLTPAGPAPTAPAPAPTAPVPAPATAPAPTPLGAPLVQGADPASTLLASWGEFHVGYAFVYADGRVIWYPDIGARVDPDMEVTGAQRVARSNGVPSPYGEFRYVAIERHLSPYGLELVRAGELTPREFLVSDPDDPDPQRREELWAEPTARLYEASTYAICHTPAGLAPASFQLPASAEALLSGKQRTFDPEIGWSPSNEPIPWDREMSAAMELAFPSDCFEVTAAEASTLYQILDANGLISHDESSTAQSADVPLEWFAGTRFAEIRGGQYSMPQISSSPIYPHGQPVPWGG